MMKTIITLLYGDDHTLKDDEENLIKDQDIQEASVKVSRRCPFIYHY